MMNFIWNKKKSENSENLPPMSEGEKWYNRLVYTGLNYWVNLGISLFIADLFLHGKGNKIFKSGVENFSQQISKFSGMKKSTSKWLAEIGLGTFSLNSGGNILLIPTKFLEDNKRNVVYWLNEKLGVDQTAPDGHKLTPDEIYIEQEQDKQSWGRMIYRRFLGWCASTGTGLAIDRILAKKLSSPVMIDGELQTHKQGQAVFTDWTKGGVNYVLNNYVPGGAKIVKNDTFQRYTGYAALDWIYTIITSQILHATNGAHKKEKPHEIEAKKTPEENKVAENNQQSEPQNRSDKKLYQNSVEQKNPQIIRRNHAEEDFVSAALAKQAKAELQVGA